jgi:hypothetical protein
MAIEEETLWMVHDVCDQSSQTLNSGYTYHAPSNEQVIEEQTRVGRQIHTGHTSTRTMGSRGIGRSGCRKRVGSDVGE